MRTNEFLKSFPPEKNDWTGKVTFSFGYPDAGWIQLAVTCTAYVQGIIIDVSAAFDPFPEFIHWLDAIAAGKLPAEFHIDEEGYGKTFRASPVNEGEFLFEIGEWMWKEAKLEEEPLYMYAQVSKKQFLSEFLKRWDDFIQNLYDPAMWEDIGVQLSALDVSKIRAFVEK